MSIQERIAEPDEPVLPDERVRKEIRQYYGGETVARKHAAFLPIERIRAKEDMELLYTISYDFGEQWTVPPTRHGVHNAVRDQVLDWELDEFPEAPLVFPEEYNSSPVYLLSLLDEYSADEELLKPAFVDQLHGSVETIYGDPVRDIFADGASRIAVCEPRYGPVYGDAPALNGRGELDIALFDVPDNHVRYIEVKSNGGDGLTPATDQIERFTDYAAELGWTVDGRIAVYDTREDQIFVCRYDYDPS